MPPQCTRSEFINKIHLTYAKKYISFETIPNSGGKEILFALEGPSDGLSYDQKFFKSTHTWCDGQVTYDLDGLFNQATQVINTSASSITITIPNSGPFFYQVIGHGGSLDFLTEEQKPKCECGKEKHGFASHSDWCEIKN